MSIRLNFLSECTSGVSPVIYWINTNLVLPDFEMKRDGTALASAATIYIPWSFGQISQGASCWSRQGLLREAILCQIGCFFTQSCCGYFDMNVKKCVNVCLDKIWRNSAKICGQNVKFTLKLWQFYPWKYFFVSILCCQKASRIIQIHSINFYT